jgi:hypothetical protein
MAGERIGSILAQVPRARSAAGSRRLAIPSGQLEGQVARGLRPGTHRTRLALRRQVAATSARRMDK